MSNPFKDGAARRAEQARESVNERYEPIILWVQPEYEMETGDGIVGAEEIIRREIRDAVKDMPFVQVATSNEPRVEAVVTEFDDD